MNLEEKLAQRKDSISLLKGFAAGVVGGLAATAAKSVAEKMVPGRIAGGPSPLQFLAEKVAGQPLGGDVKASDIKASDSKGSDTEVIHWVFGAAAGGFYGVLAELYPWVTAKNGATFGLTLMALTQEGALPVSGLDRQPETRSLREHGSEASAHVVYGVVTEKVRGLLRGLLH